MTSTKELAEVWQEFVFNHDSIQEITGSIYNEEISEKDSEGQSGKLYFNEDINFCFFRVLRSPMQSFVAKQRTYNYKVEITYIKEKKPNENTEKIVLNFFEVLDALVNSELGTNWQQKITIWKPQTEAVDVLGTEINNLKCIKAIVVYEAEKHFVA